MVGPHFDECRPTPTQLNVGLPLTWLDLSPNQLDSAWLYLVLVELVMS